MCLRVSGRAAAEPGSRTHSASALQSPSRGRSQPVEQAAAGDTGTADVARSPRGAGARH